MSQVECVQSICQRGWKAILSNHTWQPGVFALTRQWQFFFRFICIALIHSAISVYKPFQEWLNGQSFVGFTWSFTSTSVTFKCFTVGLITTCPMENEPQQNQDVRLSFFFFPGIGLSFPEQRSQQAEQPCCHVQRQLTHFPWHTSGSRIAVHCSWGRQNATVLPMSVVAASRVWFRKGPNNGTRTPAYPRTDLIISLSFNSPSEAEANSSAFL